MTGRRRGRGTPAISVRQPWAWAIAAGLKDVENRTWTTRYRGPLLIHASTNYNPGDWRDLRRRHGIEAPDVDELVLGALIARAELVDVVRNSDSPWARRGNYHFVFENIRPLARPVRCPGRLGLFQPARHS